MARMEWHDDLNTGIDVIDRQHRRIVDYINQLEEVHIRHPFRPDPEAGRVINELVDYTLSHFGFEESLMEDSGYEFTRAHQKVHELFTKRVAEFQARFKAGENVTDELHNLLVSWLGNHIRNDDASYALSIKRMLDNQAKEKTGGWLSRTLGRFFGRG